MDCAYGLRTRPLALRLAAVARRLQPWSRHGTHRDRHREPLLGGWRDRRDHLPGASMRAALQAGSPLARLVRRVVGGSWCAGAAENATHGPLPWWAVALSRRCAAG